MMVIALSNFGLVKSYGLVCRALYCTPLWMPLYPDDTVSDTQPQKWNCCDVPNLLYPFGLGRKVELFVI